MTRLLASVLSAAEAELALAGGADIVDLKDPRRGALGALPEATIRDAVARVAGRRPVSATAGDLPMIPDKVAAAVAQIAACGVDFVKVGVFPGGDAKACFARLAKESAGGTRLVAVLFADQRPDLDLIEDLRDCGFAGAMLDTAEKTHGRLRGHLDEPRLRRFVRRGQAAGLFTGLAGSLRLDDVAPLLALGPDYLGFRGALTGGGRAAALDPDALAILRAAIPYAASAANSATAAAGAQRADHSLASSEPSISAAKST